MSLPQAVGMFKVALGQHLQRAQQPGPLAPRGEMKSGLGDKTPAQRARPDGGPIGPALHCGKAVNRAKLWRAESQIDPAALPTVGKIIAALGKRDNPQASMDDAQINQHYDHSVRHDLY